MERDRARQATRARSGTRARAAAASARVKHFHTNALTVDVGRAFRVGLSQHADDGQQDLLHRLHGAPALIALLIAIRVLASRVQDRDAHLAAFLGGGKGPQWEQQW